MVGLSELTATACRGGSDGGPLRGLPSPPREILTLRCADPPEMWIPPQKTPALHKGLPKAGLERVPLGLVAPQGRGQSQRCTDSLCCADGASSSGRRAFGWRMAVVLRGRLDVALQDCVDNLAAG